MARYSFSTQLHPDAIRDLTSSPSGAVAKALLRRGLLVETAAKRNLGGNANAPKRVDTGRLRSSIATTLAIEAGKTIILDREAVIEMADRYGVSIVAWREAQALRLAG